MTEAKAPAASPKLIALPDTAPAAPTYVIQPEIIDTLVSELAELVSRSVAELRL